MCLLVLRSDVSLVFSYLILPLRDMLFYAHFVQTTCLKRETQPWRGGQWAARGGKVNSRSDPWSFDGGHIPAFPHWFLP